MRPDAFVSSRMAELAPERLAVKNGLRDAGIDAWVFEDDAGARPETIQKVFLDEVREADLYIGIFWKGYGQYTIDEFEEARIHGKPRFVYEKCSDQKGRRDPNIKEARNPQLQEFLKRIGDVETGVTIRRFDRVDELRDSVRADVSAWLTRHKIEQARLARDPGLAYESVLRDAVRKYWIDGVLAGALHRRVESILNLDHRLELQWDAFNLPEQTRLARSEDTDLSNLYFRFGRFELILGPPGSGKTTLLLHLARQLLQRSELDVDAPVPVVFDLSTWIDPAQPLGEWIVEELADVKYKAARKWSRQRLERSRIIPLLDGLDEVKRDHRGAAVDEINKLKRDHPDIGMVVCADPEDFDEIRGLDAGGAIQIRELTPEQVKRFVTEGGDALQGLQQALGAGYDEELARMATLPLTLNLLSLAYRDVAEPEIRAYRSEAGGPFHLLETYVLQMYQQVGERVRTERFEPRLRWLAAKLDDHGGTALALENLQPTWLDQRKHRFAYLLATRSVEGAAFGLALGLFVGLFAWELAWEAAEATVDELVDVLLAGLLLGSSVGFVLGLLTGTIRALADNRRRLQNDVRPAEVLRWQWRGAVRGGMRGLVLGAAVGICILLLAELGPGGWLVIPIVALAFSVSNFLLQGVQTGIARTKEEPNEGIALSLRSAVAAGTRLASGSWLAVGLVLGLLAKEQGGFVENLGYGLLSAIPFGVIVGFAGLFFFGGRTVLRNKVLRWMLWKFDYLPRDLTSFLDLAVSAVLLQKAGGAYRFVHRYFLKHFARRA